MKDLIGLEEGSSRVFIPSSALKGSAWIGSGTICFVSLCLSSVCLAFLLGMLVLPASAQQVLFSRSAHAVQTQVPSITPAQTAQVPEATNAERAALAISAYRLHVHLVPSQQEIAVEANLIVRNAGAQPLAEIALQLSSSLHFEGIEAEGQPLAYQSRTVVSDVDHTGALTEADIRLKQPLAAGQRLALKVIYGGRIEQTGQRLQAIGVPPAVAMASDWDRITPEFTGLRGFGNVVWYPVSSVPARLGEGNQLFEEVGRAKLAGEQTEIAIDGSVEYLNQPPNVAILCGHSVALAAPLAKPYGSFPGVIPFSLSRTRLGFAVPSLIVAHRVLTTQDGVVVAARPENEDNADSYLAEAHRVLPLVESWLGPKPQSTLTIVDLPEAADAPAEIGPTLLTSLDRSTSLPMELGLVHTLAHAYFGSPEAWLEEGVPEFIVSLWIESTEGRMAALEYLDASRGALALAEPASPGVDAGEPLVSAWDPIYLRTKAAYVLWMLRGIVGDADLQKALSEYAVLHARDVTSAAASDSSGQAESFESVLEQVSEKKLGWFFADWVDHDPGLPSLAITHLYTSPENLGLTLVAVTIANNGYAAVDVPVTLLSSKTKITQRVHIPMRSTVTVRIEIVGQPLSVQVNDGSVPEVGASIHLRTLTTQRPLQE